MNKYIIILLLFAGSMKISAQVTINLQLSPVGIVQKNQLWNLSLINSGTAGVLVKLNMVMTDIATGQPVLSASTNTINLSQGSRIIQYAELMPITYTVLNSNYNVDPSATGFLPVGNFNICYQAMKQGAEGFYGITEECASIEIEPLTPPYLSLPENEAELEEDRPFFTWLPPNPTSLFNNLSYSFKLVEVLQKQQASEAIQQNLPIVFQPGITGNTFNYPTASPKLDTGKTYAWQVVANNNNLRIANSEVWTFKLKQNGQVNPVAADAPFYKLKLQTGTAYFVCNGVLRYEYINELNDRQAVINIFDISNKSKKQLVKEVTQNLNDGQNLVSIDLKEDGLRKGHIYLVELINSRNEIWNCSFEYKPTN
jgi:Domain of Unknown Function (DUF928)